MKYFILTFFIFLGHLLAAQQSFNSAESFRFYKAKPQTSLKRSYKLNLREQVVPKKAPILLVKPVTKTTNNVWKSKKLSKTNKTKKYQKNALTFSYDLSKKTTSTQKVFIVEGNLVQAFVPTHPFALTLKTKPDFAKASLKPGVNIQNLSLIKVETPKQPKNTIYPNPTTGVFNIQLAEEATEIKVVNLVGRIVLTRKVTGKSFYGLDISHLPKGTYIASFLQKGKWFSQRIVLVK